MRSSYWNRNFVSLIRAPKFDPSMHPAILNADSCGPVNFKFDKAGFLE